MRLFATLSLILGTVLLSIVTSVDGFAQSEGDDFKIGTWREVESKVLGETRKIIVSKPDDYDSSDKRYCVLYLLDGDDHFHHTTGLIDFLVGNQAMPDTIVVAIPNTDRTRDLTPKPEVKDEGSPTAGGADNFARFFKEELIPFVDDNYRTRPFRILVGHSYGGLFTVHTLVHHSELFDAYIAISPSFQWDNQKLVGQTQTFFKESKELPKALFMTVGNEGGQLHGGLLKVAGSLKERTPPRFEWDTRIMEEETHGSVPYRSTRQGLEFIFKDWSLKDPIPLYEIGGVPAVLKHFAKASAKYGIEIGPPTGTMMQLVYRLSTNGRMEEAREVLEHDPKTFPPAAMLYSIIGNSHKEEGENELAIECYKRALELNPADKGAKGALKELGVDAASITKKVAVPESTLKEYVGTYKYPGDEAVIKVTLEKGALFGQATDQPKFELTPVSDSEFVEPQGYFRIEFERNDDKTIKQMTLHVVDGSKVVCPRKVDDK